MAIRIIKTNESEAERIMENRLHFIIRTDKDYFRENDIIQFMVMKDKKPVKRDITGKCFIVTTIADRSNAPVEKGYQLIGFRRMS